jgi:hypothetical protein
MGFRVAYRFALAAALLGPSAAWASSGGITNQSVNGCTLGGCHGDAPGAFNYTAFVQYESSPGVWSSTSPTIARNAALSIRYFLDYNSGTVAGRGGFDMTANGGTLTESDGGIQNFSGELTHTTPRALTGNDVIFNNITWTAPNTSNTFTIFACGQAVNFNGLVSGDGPHDCDTLAIVVNNPPVISNVANETINEDGTTGAIGFTVSDTETVATSLSVTRSSSNTTLVPLANVVLGGSGTNRTVTVTPAANQSGSTTITLTVTDGNSQTDTDTFLVTVNSVNDAPTLNAIGNPAAINEDAGQQTVNLSGIGAGGGESQTLTVTASSANTAVIPHPSVTYTSPNATGSISYTPVANASGSAVITVTVTDSGGTLNGGVNAISRNFTATVNPVNDAPNAVNDTPGIAKNSTNNVLDVLANDSDIDSGTLTITNVTTPSNGGGVVIQGVAPNQTLSYSPATNYSGIETFNYTISDGSLTDTATVTVTVSEGSAPTPANDGPFAVVEDSGGNMFDVLANDTDPDVGDTLTVTQVNGSGTFPVAVTNGSVSRSGSGPGNTLSFTPSANSNGPISFTYTVQDAAGLTAMATVSATVSAVNDAPSISAPASIGVTEDVLSPLTGISFADVDSGSGPLLATVSVGSGTLSATSGGGVTVGGSPISRTLSGTLANLNAFLAGSGLGFTTASNNTGNVLVGITLNDNGNSGSGGPLVATPVNVTLTVTAVNDAPQITSSPVTTAQDGVPYAYQVAVTDVDDLNNGVQLNWSLPTAPAGMTVSTTGLIEWTPPLDTAGGVDVTVQVADGGENGAAPATQSFTINVSVPDSDGDGMPDSFENLHGLDPGDPSDADADADGDGVSNLDEYLGGTDPTVDDIAPVVTAPADLIVPSTGYLTVVDPGAPSAIDGLDGALTATSDLVSTALRPGRYVVTWTAQDGSGNVGTDTQQVDVLPLVELQGLPAVAGEGGPAAVLAVLNGEPPEYPVEIPYTVGGTAGPADSDAVAGTIVINSGTTGFLLFAITADGVPEGPETLVITATGASQAALGSRATATIPIRDGNVPPQVFNLSGTQNGSPRFTAYTGDGQYVLLTNAFDGNGDVLTYDWAGSDDALGIDADATANPGFDPVAMAPGAYNVRLQVSDGNGGVATAHVLLLVAGGTSADSDIDSDGIPDSVDAVTDYAAVLPDQTGDLAGSVLLETDAPHSLRRGRTSLAAGRTGALVAMGDIVAFGVGEGGLPLGADSYDNVGGIFDFEIHGLNPGETSRVVLPLQTAIRAGSVYRKFAPAGGWHDFAVDANNAVASARSALGQCPGPSSEEYVDGLRTFDDCVRLTLQDGGPNDADGVADGVIRDPGGVAVTDAPPDEAAPSVSGGAFFAALWLPLALLLRLRRRAGAAALAFVALLVAAPAQAEHHVRVHYSGDLASGFDNNVTNAQQTADIRESGFASAGGTADYSRQLSLYSTLLLRGSVQGEYWNSFDGLNNGKATAMARFLYRGDGDFYTPTYAAWVSASIWEFDSAIRDSNEYRAGAFITENITTQITGRFQLGVSRRESDGAVFDVSGVSASVNLDWVPVPRATVYTGYQYYAGGVTSTATPTLWIGLAAEAIEADDAFGGLAGGLLAYRLDAKAQIATLGFNYALSRKLSADLQGQYITTRADARNEYERMAAVLSLLARF